jgi:hypothetical protein
MHQAFGGRCSSLTPSISDWLRNRKTVEFFAFERRFITCIQLWRIRRNYKSGGFKKLQDQRQRMGGKNPRHWPSSHRRAKLHQKTVDVGRIRNRLAPEARARSSAAATSGVHGAISKQGACALAAYGFLPSCCIRRCAENASTVLPVSSLP